MFIAIKAMHTIVKLIQDLGVLHLLYKSKKNLVLISGSEGVPEIHRLQTNVQNVLDYL